MRTALLILLIAFCPCGAPATHAHTIDPERAAELLGVELQDAHVDEDATVVSDPRDESRTIASFPEWYIVYSAQEYGAFVSRGGMPSDFPYFDAIAQYWDIDATVRERLAAEGGIDSTTDTVLATIGWSFAVEYGIIGTYEKTIGRLSALLALNYKSPEDSYADRVASDYGSFLEHTPWYAFPYVSALGGLWREYGLGSFWIRGMERRLAFTLGYSAKAVYGGVIGYLSRSTYGEAGLTTTVVLEGIDVETVRTIAGVLSAQSTSTSAVEAVLPRYRAFKAPFEQLLERGARFVSIEGHDRIMVTFVTASPESCDLPGERVMDMPFVTDPSKHRIAQYFPLRDAASVRTGIIACGSTLEHVYDY